MTVAISAEGGAACVELADHHGEVFVYEVYRLPDDLMEKRWAVERRGDRTGKHSHAVSLRDGKVWGCSCRSFKFNVDRLTTGCKHTRSVQEVIEFYKKLAGDGS
jgi:hypothetical protein